MSVSSSRCLTNRLTDSLKSMVMLTGIAGEWRQGENLHQYRADSGAVLNWWKSTGTVTFQGPEAAAANLKTAFLKFSGRLKGEALEEGWIYKRSRSKENWIIFFYKDWEIAGISNKETRQKKWLVKMRSACAFCGSTEDLTQGHIILASRGGSDGLHNKQLLCQPCNLKKGNRMSSA
jgi:hypothetical protein